MRVADAVVVNFRAIPTAELILLPRPVDSMRASCKLYVLLHLVACR